MVTDGERPALPVEAGVDYDGPTTGVFEGGYATCGGRPLWLHVTPPPT